jgi:hypothetical protein
MATRWYYKGKEYGVKMLISLLTSLWFMHMYEIWSGEQYLVQQWLVVAVIFFLVSFTKTITDLA